MAIAVTQTFAASVPAAERCWQDTTRWPRWVDGLDAVTAVSGQWPEAGATVRWVSGPAGRGAVIERVTAREPLSQMTTAISDDSIEGKQTVSFSPDGDCVAVTLGLEYRLRRGSPFMRLVDLVFIRRAMRASLAATLTRFGAELEASAAPPP